MEKLETRDGLMLDGLALSDYEDGGCWLVILDDWEISVILSSLRYAHWLARWSNLGPYTWDELQAKITQMEHCLMAGCDVDLLLEKFDGLISAVQGITLTCSPDLTVNCDNGVNNGGGYGGDFGIDPDPDPGQPTPGEPPESWTDPPEEYDDYKCKAANVLVLNLAEFLAICDVASLKDYSPYPTPQDAIDWIAGTLTLAVRTIGQMLNSAAAWIGQKLVCATTGEGCSAGGGGEVTWGTTTSFYDTRLLLLNDREDATCELYNGQTVDEAKAAITDRLSGYLDEGSYSEEEQSLFLNLLDTYLSNVWLNRLFVKDDQVENYSDVSAVDCGECGCQEELFTFDTDLEGFDAYQCHSGAHSTVVAVNERVEIDGDVDGGLGHYGGIRKVYSPGKVIVEGDFASIEVTRHSGTGNLYLQYDFSDETSDYSQVAIQSYGIDEMFLLSRDLTGQAGKTLTALRIYLDVYNDMSVRLDNFTEKLCGGDAG